jgi:6-pyruvoyl-tetrahydropterin synthase
MELFIEKGIQQNDGYISVSLYVRDLKTVALIDKKLLLQKDLDILNDIVEDFNERPWQYPVIQINAMETIYAERKKLLHKKLPIETQVEPQVEVQKTPEQQARQDVINKKIQASKERNKDKREEAKDLSARMIAEADIRNKDCKFEDNYYQSALEGCHKFEVYVESSMSDDCYGFGDIKVQQTLDDDIETIYEFYDDYIF